MKRNRPSPDASYPLGNPKSRIPGIRTIAFAILLTSCAAYGPYHANTASEPFNSVRGPKDGRYKLAIYRIRRSRLSSGYISTNCCARCHPRGGTSAAFCLYSRLAKQRRSQATSAGSSISLIRSRAFPRSRGERSNVIGVYIAWRGVDLTVPVAEVFNVLEPQVHRSTIAAQNGCLATISELALAARAPEKSYHHCILLGHSFGGLVLENTISHSILDASSTGSRNTSPWDMAVAFNPADSSVGCRQLISELDYLYKYDPKRHAYVGRSPGTEAGQRRRRKPSVSGHSSIRE